MTLLDFLQKYDVRQLSDCFVSDGVRRLRVHPDAIAATARLLADEPLAAPETFPLYGYAHAGSLMMTTFRMDFEVIGVPAPSKVGIPTSALVPNADEESMLVSEGAGHAENLGQDSPNPPLESPQPVVAPQLTLL